jgi:mono/diheme cytochrome c family protein
LIASVLALTSIGVAWWVGSRGVAGPEAAVIAQGRNLYLQYCASCHGRNLEGQPNWQTRLENGRLPAPPHDASGHTWHHSDEVLFRIVKEGLGAIAPGYESDMPAFGGVLSDAEIEAILTYIKSTWPQREREYQRMQSESG